MQDADDHTFPGYRSPWFANRDSFLLISPMDRAFSSRIIYWNVRVVCSTNVFSPPTSMKEAAFVIMVPISVQRQYRNIQMSMALSDFCLK